MLMYYHSRACPIVRNSMHRVRRKILDLPGYIVRKPLPKPFTRSLLHHAAMNSVKGEPDIIIRNARLINRQLVDIAISSNYIAEVAPSGKNSILSRDSIILDAGGMSVLPGFNDCHVHLMVGAEHLQGCDAEKAENQDDLAFMISDFSRQNNKMPVIYVYGAHYTDPPLIPPENARKFLDSIVSDKPLFVFAHDLHTGWANSKALQEADCMRVMPPFPRLIHALDLEHNMPLDNEGLPTGELLEPPVYFTVESVLRSKFPLSSEQKLSALQNTCSYLAGKGLTGVFSMGLDLPPEDIELILLLVELEETKKLPVRVYSSFSVVPDEHMLTDIIEASAIRDMLHKARQGIFSIAEIHSFLIESLKAAVELRHNTLSELLRHHTHNLTHPLAGMLHQASHDLKQIMHNIHLHPHLKRLEQRLSDSRNSYIPKDSKISMNSVKLFMDGVIEKDTAFRLDKKTLEGIPAFSQQNINLAVAIADSLGLQVATHSIGDGAVRNVLNAIEAARLKNKALDKRRGHLIRHRIEHIEMCRAEDIERFYKTGTIASMQSLHEREPVTLWHKMVPEKYWENAFPWQSLKEICNPLIFGSDWPIVPCNCLQGIYHAVTRKPWLPGIKNQALTLQQACASYCRVPAYASYEESARGEIKPGALADVVVLSDNIEDIIKKGYEKYKVLYTICDGEITHGKD